MGIPIPFLTPITKKLGDVPFHTMSPMEFHKLREERGEYFFQVAGYPPTSKIAEYEVEFFGFITKDGIFPLVRVLLKPSGNLEMFRTDHKIYHHKQKRISI